MSFFFIFSILTSAAAAEGRYSGPTEATEDKCYVSDELPRKEFLGYRLGKIIAQCRTHDLVAPLQHGELDLFLTISS